MAYLDELSFNVNNNSYFDKEIQSKQQIPPIIVHNLEIQFAYNFSNTD